MVDPVVAIITITEPVELIGRHFLGDYGASHKHIMEVQDSLKQHHIGFVPFKVFGIYYDDPMTKNASECRSFHAVFPEKMDEDLPQGLERFKLSGKFIQTILKGDPSKTIMMGYGALFNHIRQNGIKLASQAGYQISSFEHGEITTEILMLVE
jgi:DNA gyrase inhibitor GyrI